jgi:hypothetical protein
LTHPQPLGYAHSPAALLLLYYCFTT